MSILLLLLLIAVFAWIPFWITLIRYRRNRKVFETGTAVTGQVLEVTTHRGTKGSVYYRALVRYPVSGFGQMQQYYCFSGGKGRKVFYEGRQLDVIYDRVRPQSFVPADLPPSKNSSIVTLLFALIILDTCYIVSGITHGRT